MNLKSTKSQDFQHVQQGGKEKRVPFLSVKNDLLLSFNWQRSFNDISVAANSIIKRKALLSTSPRRIQIIGCFTFQHNDTRKPQMRFV